MILDELKAIALEFNLPGYFFSFEKITAGHINLTYKISMKNGENINNYIFQRINKYVFKKPEEVMENIVNVTKYIASLGVNNRKVLNFVPSKENKFYHVDSNGDYWRVYYFIGCTISYNQTTDLEIIKEAGKGFGEFQKQLADYPANTLHETIKDFHNTIFRYEQLDTAIKNNSVNRLESTKDVVNEYLKHRSLAIKMTEMLQKGELPLRVTHNDTKFNNILFNQFTKKHQCVIDLDTIMPGLCGFDFGDAMRFITNTAEEDEKDLSLVKFSIDKYKAFAEGFLSEVKDSLTQNEIDTMALGAITQTLECGSRFLTDYLSGDVYFHVNYPEHNLVRSKNQLTLALDMIKHLDEMNEIVHTICGR